MEKHACTRSEAIAHDLHRQVHGYLMSSPAASDLARALSLVRMALLDARDPMDMGRTSKTIPKPKPEMRGTLVASQNLKYKIKSRMNATPYGIKDVEAW